MQTLTQYLSNIMGSVLLGLPREIKELIYFDALSHTANKILVSANTETACGDLTNVLIGSPALL